ncbi:MAG: tRNA lysidine(34) synthetase TilS [Spirochaetaceae bacterium]|nr:tRNA lysidine(34) synthetase TilS [Spirochaetaceae bacterium]
MKSTESKTSKILKSAEKTLSPILGKENNNILLAFSAGPDSTALLDILFRLKDKLNIKVIAAYFDHCLRNKDEIKKEIRIAENNCSIRSIPFFMGKDSKGTIDKFSKKHGIEAAARKVRYSFLNSIAENNNCKYIAVAHNLDDNCETIIMRFFQGSGPEGLKGIGENSGNILRPLINVSKSDIFEYLKENKIKYSCDSTNKENDYLRNKIRNNLIPSIKKVFPGYEKSLLLLAEKMANADSIIDEKLAEKIEWKKKGSALVTEYDNFLSLPEYLKIKAIYSAFNISENSEERLPYKFLKPLFSKKTGVKSHIVLKGHDYTLEREGKNLFWKRDIVTIKKNSYHLIVKPEKEYELPVIFDKNNKKVYISSRIIKISECKKDDLWIPVNKITADIHIRNRTEGDFIVLEYGTKTIKKLFLEMKIERYFRDLIPIICNNKDILAVWGSVFNYRNRVSRLICDADKDNDIDVLLFESRFF